MDERGKRWREEGKVERKAKRPGPSISACAPVLVLFCFSIVTHYFVYAKSTSLFGFISLSLISGDLYPPNIRVHFAKVPNSAFLDSGSVETLAGFF